MNLTPEDVIGLTSCWKCKAQRGQPCVYLPVAYPSQVHPLIGKPTKQPHAERYGQARQTAQRIDRRGGARPAPLSTRDQIALAEARFDREEQRALIVWLARYAHVLTCLTESEDR